jgi:hypothetical protein
MEVLLTLSSGKPLRAIYRYDNGAFWCLFPIIGPLQTWSENMLWIINVGCCTHEYPDFCRRGALPICITYLHHVQTIRNILIHCTEYEVSQSEEPPLRSPNGGAIREPWNVFTLLCFVYKCLVVLIWLIVDRPKY